MNIDLAVIENVTKDIEELNKEITITWNKLAELVNQKEKLLLYQMVSSLKTNDRQLNLHKEDLPAGSSGSQDTTNHRLPDL